MIIPDDNTQKSEFMVELKAMLCTISILIGTLIGSAIVLFVYLSPNLYYYHWMPEMYSIRIIIVIIAILIFIATVFGMSRLFKRKTIVNEFICSLILAAMMINLLSLLVSWLGWL